MSRRTGVLTGVLGAVLLASAPGQSVCGDCQGDLVVDILDSLTAAQIGAALMTPSAAQSVTCDVNSTGTIDVIDALLIAQAAALLPVTLTCPASAPPSCTVNSPAPASPASGDVPLDFDLVDPDSPTLTVTFQFSTTGGQQYQPATPAAGSLPPFDTNPALNVPVGPGQVFVWNSVVDVPGNSNTVLRIQVDDGSTQQSCGVSVAVGNSGALPPNPGDLTISEIHADPEATILGDANGDGVRSATEDEFVEIVNITAFPLDFTGLTIADGVGLRHVVPAGTIIPGGGALVVFGGGTPTGPFGGNVVQTATTGTLGLNNTSDVVIIEDLALVRLDLYAYGPEAGMDEAVLADPEPTSVPSTAGGRPMVLHSTLPPGLRFSPGTRADGVTGSW